MKKALILSLVLAAFSLIQAQENKTLRAGPGSVVVVEKLPITLVVNGDTLVMDDQEGEDHPLHLIMRKKGEHSCTQVTTEKKQVWTTVIDDDDDKDGKQMHITLKQIDEDELDGKNIRVHLETCDENSDEKEKKVVVITKKMNDTDEEQEIQVTVDDKKVKPVIGLGILLEDKEGRLLVSKVLGKSAVKDMPFKENDRLVQIDGQEVNSAKDFFKIYKPIEVGKTVQVRVERDNKVKDLSFAKPKEKGKMMIIECEK